MSILLEDGSYIFLVLKWEFLVSSYSNNSKYKLHKQIELQIVICIQIIITSLHKRYEYMNCRHNTYNSSLFSIMILWLKYKINVY